MKQSQQMSSQKTQPSQKGVHGSQKGANSVDQNAQSSSQVGKTKINRRDLNLIPPSATIVQSLNIHNQRFATGNTNSLQRQKDAQEENEYASNANRADSRSAFQNLTLNSTKNNSKQPWENILAQHKVTSVKHEKIGSNQTNIMQGLKQFQRVSSKQQRQSSQVNQQKVQNVAGMNQDQMKNTNTQMKISLQTVTPVASNSVAVQPVSTKSNKSQISSSKVQQRPQTNAGMMAEAHAQRKQNFTCTMTKGSLKLTKKSPSAGRGDSKPTGKQEDVGRHNQIRDRSLGSKPTKMVNFQTHQAARVTQSQQKQSSIPSKQVGKKLNSNSQIKQDLRGTGDNETLKSNNHIRLRDERSNEMIRELDNTQYGKNVLTPNTTTNKNQQENQHLLVLKNFQPQKNSSTLVTPKYFKFKQTDKHDKSGDVPQVTNVLRSKHKQAAQANDQKGTNISKEKISLVKQKPFDIVGIDKIQKTKTVMQNAYGTSGTSPDSKLPQSKIDSQKAAKSLSNNSRSKYQTQQNNLVSQLKAVKQQVAHSVAISKKKNNVEPSAPQIQYSVLKDQQQQVIKQTIARVITQQTNAYPSSNSALNGSSELQKRFTRAEVVSNKEPSVSSGKANKSFQFGHNTALMSCSSGGDSSNPPQAARHRSTSGKHGAVKHIKITQIQNINPVQIQPKSSTSAGIEKNLDSSYLGKGVMPQTTDNQNEKKFTFTLNSKEAIQKAQRPNKHSNLIQQNGIKMKMKQVVPQTTIPETQKKITQRKSTSAKKKQTGQTTQVQQLKQMQMQKTNPQVQNDMQALGKVNLTSDDEISYENQNYHSSNRASKNGKISHQIQLLQQNFTNGRVSQDNTPNTSQIQIQNRVTVVKQASSTKRQESLNLSSDSNNNQELKNQIQQQQQFNMRKDSTSRRMEAELQQYKDEVARLKAEMHHKDILLRQFTMNMDSLENQPKHGLEQIGSNSGNMIQQTLTRLQNRLTDFTTVSKKNQGDLRKITQSVISSNRNSIGIKNMESSHLSPTQESPDKKLQNKDSKPPNPGKGQFQRTSKPTQSHLQLSASASQGRPSQMSEGIESLITIGEYFGQSSEAYRTEARDNLQSPVKQFNDKDHSPKGTIGTIASEVQLLNDRKQDLQIEGHDKVNMFGGRMDGEDDAELTSLEDADMSHMQDASLIQLEKDMNRIEKSRKVQVQSQKNFSQLQNNFMDDKNVKQNSPQNIILEDIEEVEDEIAQQLVPKKQSSQKKNGLWKVTEEIENEDSKKLSRLPDDSFEKNKDSSTMKGESSFGSSNLRNQLLLGKSEKLSKTLSKNHMKLKMAAKIKEHKPDQSDQDNNSLDQNTLEKSKDNLIGHQNKKKKIQLPLKIQNLKKISPATLIDQKSLERVQKSKDATKDLGVYGNVAIKNVKNSVSIGDQSVPLDSETLISSQDSKLHLHSQVQALKQIGLSSKTTPIQKVKTQQKSPQTRVMQGHQGKMITQRLEIKDTSPVNNPIQKTGSHTTTNVQHSSHQNTQQMMIVHRLKASQKQDASKHMVDTQTFGLKKIRKNNFMSKDLESYEI